MGSPIHITSTSQWQSLLSENNVVVADFYADWCGPCKMIAPHFERMATEHSRPKKMAFCKVNVDSQSIIAQTQGVSAMPTFMVYHHGSRIVTIRGADQAALKRAVADAARLADTAGSTPGRGFSSPGHKLGGESVGVPLAAASVAVTARSWDIGALLRAALVFIQLYLISLFSLDPYKAAQESSFNVKNKPSASARVGQSKGVPTRSGAAQRPAASQPANYKTLADLGGE